MILFVQMRLHTIFETISCILLYKWTVARLAKLLIHSLICILLYEGLLLNKCLILILIRPLLYESVGGETEETAHQIGDQLLVRESLPFLSRSLVLDAPLEERHRESHPEFARVHPGSERLPIVAAIPELFHVQEG